MVKNILITGITGMLGQAVYRHFSKLNGYKIFGITRQINYFLPGVDLFYGDISSDFFIKSISDIPFYSVIHCSAEVDVNSCEVNRELAFASNVQATKNLSSFLRIEKFIFISTDSIFDGQIGAYKEDSFSNPLNYYAKTKVLAEDSIKESINNYYILRTNIYGFKRPLKKSLFEWAYKELENGNTIDGYTNMYFNPMYVGQLAYFIDVLLNADIKFGTYNVSSNEVLSKYDFLLKIANLFDFDNSLINPKEFQNNNLVAPRALNTTLDNFKIRSAIRNFDFSLDTGFKMLKNDW